MLVNCLVCYTRLTTKRYCARKRAKPLNTILLKHRKAFMLGRKHRAWLKGIFWPDHLNAFGRFLSLVGAISLIAWVAVMSYATYLGYSTGFTSDATFHWLFISFPLCGVGLGSFWLIVGLFDFVYRDR